MAEQGDAFSLELFYDAGKIHMDKFILPFHQHFLLFQVKVWRVTLLRFRAILTRFLP